MAKCSVCIRQTVAGAGLIGTLAEPSGEVERPPVMGERCPWIASCCAGVTEAKPRLELEVAIANRAGAVKGLLEALDGHLNPVARTLAGELGPSHKETLAARSRLAFALHRAGRLEESEGQLSAVLEACERSLGTSHEMTDAGRRTLAAVRQELYG
jgi:hypothetical protein